MFYLRLASHNLRKNKVLFLPFILALVALVALNTMTFLISQNSALSTLPGGALMVTLFSFSNRIILFFSVIFALYTNSFVLKQRQKEWGLYHILGMGKRQLYLVSLTEKVVTGIITLVIGLLSGVVLTRLGYLVIRLILGQHVHFNFPFQWSSILQVSLWFALLIVILWLADSWRIFRTKTLELFKSSDQGEREPKVHWLTALIAVVGLGIGYYFALTINNPISAFQTFFFAVIAVIIGTYAFFIAGSIAVLKVLKRRPGIYYRPHPFLFISQMLYRMRQNAAGLASICILSTMVLITLATTISLYVGRQAMVDTSYPYDVSLNITTSHPKVYTDLLQRELTKKGLKTDPMVVAHVTPVVSVKKQGSQFTSRGATYTNTNIQFFTAADFKQATGKTVTLSDNQVALYTHNLSVAGKVFKLNGDVYPIKQRLSNLGRYQLISPNLSDQGDVVMIVADQAAMKNVITDFDQTSQNQLKSSNYVIAFDYRQAKKSTALAYGRVTSEKLRKLFNSATQENYSMYSYMVKAEIADSSAQFIGGFLFIGILFGITFMIATGLIIYYKQLSEGLADRDRFIILQKVGMSHRQVKQQINSQVLAVFFFPLIVALIHVAVAFKIMTKMLALFALKDTVLIAQTVIGVSVGFAILYLIIYLMTSKVYFKIVARK